MRMFQLLRLAAQAEALRWKRTGRGYAIQAGLGAAAAIFFLLLLVMLHVAALIWLARGRDPAVAALIVAGVDLVLVALLGWLAARHAEDPVAVEAHPGARRRAAPGGRHDGAGGHGHAAAAQPIGQEGADRRGADRHGGGAGRPALRRRAASPCTAEPPSRASRPRMARADDLSYASPRGSRTKERRVSETTEPTVLTRREGAAGTLLMNRPKTLNALDLAMIRDFQAAIDAWKDDAAVKLVVLEGAGGKAFCAGGDVRRIRELAIAGEAAAIEAFFAEEYAVNRGIATFGKPWVSLIDGFCMGGGIGLSVHGAPIVVTESAMLAMPETAIALFPDVGTSYVLPRLPGAIGTWLALTGTRLRGGDAVHAGLATHYVPKAKLPALREALLGGDVGGAGALRRAGAGARLRAAPRRHRPLLRPRHHAGDPGGARRRGQRLGARADRDPAADVADLALRLAGTIRRGAGATLDECLEMELALGRSVVNDHPDFREGVRSVLVDKGGTPTWTPATIEAVDPAAIRALFAG